MTSMTPGTTRATPCLTGRRPGRLRLTRRGRVTLLVSLILAVLAISVLVGPAVMAVARRGPSDQPTVVVVQPGQTLWSIARAARPGSDVRDTIGQLEALNQLSPGQPLMPGERLSLPSSRP